MQLVELRPLVVPAVDLNQSMAFILSSYKLKHRGTGRYGTVQLCLVNVPSRRPPCRRHYSLLLMLIFHLSRCTSNKLSDLSKVHRHLTFAFDVVMTSWTELISSVQFWWLPYCM